MEILDDTVTQFLKAPVWVWVLAGLVLLDLAWRKSSLPDRYLIAANFAAAIGGFSALNWDAPSYRVYYSPHAYVLFHAFMLFLANQVFHEGIMAQIKARFPNVKWPDRPPTPPPETKAPALP